MWLCMQEAVVANLMQDGNLVLKTECVEYLQSGH